MISRFLSSKNLFLKLAWYISEIFTGRSNMVRNLYSFVFVVIFQGLDIVSVTRDSVST